MSERDERVEALAEVLADEVLTESRNGYYRIDKAILMVSLTRALNDSPAMRDLVWELGEEGL